MALAASVMSDLASALEERHDSAIYAADLRILLDGRLLDHLHWSDDLQSFADYGLHTDHVVLKRPPPAANNGRQGMPVTNSEKVVVVGAGICEDGQLGLLLHGRLESLSSSIDKFRRAMLR